MILFGSRPENGRADFEQKTADHLEHLEGLELADGSPNYAAIHAFVDDNEDWQSGVKKHFMAAQHRKCGYCEVKITDSTGDVEHYRPKKAVWDLASAGEELEDLVNQQGRKYDRIHASGYWWLAYAWDNYLVTCTNCNRKWKSALFPVDPPREGAPQPGDEHLEQALVLDPFDDRNPAEHLTFDELGQIEAFGGSRIGQKTIETCGLDRESLRDSRELKAIKAHQLVKELESASVSRKQTILADIKLNGNLKYLHAGVFRAIFEQKTRLPWSVLDALG